MTELTCTRWLGRGLLHVDLAHVFSTDASVEVAVSLARALRGGEVRLLMLDLSAVDLIAMEQVVWLSNISTLASSLEARPWVVGATEPVSAMLVMFAPSM